MNFQQLQYIVAVDELRHFQKAAEACFVTPATLSMMIKKLEQELSVIIFDRSKQPITVTSEGTVVIEKAKDILYQTKELEHLTKFAKEEVAGTIRMAIIPTLAPYLGYLFLPKLMATYPRLKIKLYEWNTDHIIEALTHNRIDIGIAATPLHQNSLNEKPVFYERLLVYNADDQQADKNYIAPEDINLSRLWLLEEEHCLRAQVINLCSLKKKHQRNLQLDFEAGSIETLLNMVTVNQGITIVPELLIHTLSEERKKNVKQFAAPSPVREISLITYRTFAKEKLLNAIHEQIRVAIAPFLDQTLSDRKVINM